MKVYQELLVAIAIEILIWILLGAYSEKSLLTSLRLPGFWYLLIAINALCLLGSTIVYELKLRPYHRKGQIFRIGLSTGLFLFIALIAGAIIYNQYNPRPDKTALENRAVIQSFFSDDEVHIKKAFQALEKRFVDSNAFELNSISVRSKDTSSALGADFIYSVYFTYFLKGKGKLLYLSKMKVFRLETMVLVFNEEAKKNEEYAGIIRAKEKQEQELVKDLSELKRKIEDSPSIILKVEK